MQYRMTPMHWRRFPVGTAWLSNFKRFAVVIGIHDGQYWLLLIHGTYLAFPLAEVPAA